MSLYKLLAPKAFAELLGKESSRRVVPVDSTWYLPNLNRNGKTEFMEQERLKGAVYFDIDDIKDRGSEFPHMLPDLKTFNDAMGKLGIRKDDILVVYDRIGNFSAPRCAWTLSVLGHSPVYLLNNFSTLKETGFPVETSKVASVTPYGPTEYKSDTNMAGEEVVSFEFLKSLVDSGDINNYQVFDARSLARFSGDAPEPRPGLSSGHVPGALPLPFTEVLEADKTFPTDKASMFKKIDSFLAEHGTHLSTEKPTIAMCGTGVTGTVIKTALEQAGINNVKLYDGSWTEWVIRDGEIAKGN